MKTASLNIRTKETKSTANCPRPTAYLNILRILFAIWVVFVHYGNFISITSGPIKTIMSLGRVATSGFFLISGFLFHITYFDKIKTKKTNGTDFFVGKVIYFLPYILFSTIALFSFASIDLMVNNSTIANPSLMNVIKCLFPFGGVFSSNISYNGNWFLGVLFFCYFLAYIIAVFCRKKDNFILTGIVPLILSIGMFFCSKIDAPFFNIRFGEGLFGFFAGFYLAVLVSNFKNFKRKTTILFKSICLIIFVAGLIIFVKDSIKTNTKALDPIGLTSIVFLIAPLVVCLYNFKPLNKISDFKLVKTISKSTLSLYLFQQPLFFFLHIFLTKFDVTYKNSSSICLICVFSAVLICFFIDIGMNKLVTYLNVKYKTFKELKN